MTEQLFFPFYSMVEEHGGAIASPPIGISPHEPRA